MPDLHKEVTKPPFPWQVYFTLLQSIKYNPGIPTTLSEEIASRSFNLQSSYLYLDWKKPNTYWADFEKDYQVYLNAYLSISAIDSSSRFIVQSIKYTGTKQMTVV